MQKDKILYALPDAREQLGGMSHSKLYQLVNAGKLRLVKIGRRSYLTHGEMHRFAASLESDESV